MSVGESSSILFMSTPSAGVLVIDLYETVIHIMQSDDILESVIGQEAEMHGGENADNIDGDSDEWPHLQEDDFYQALAALRGCRSLLLGGSQSLVTAYI